MTFPIDRALELVLLVLLAEVLWMALHRPLRLERACSVAAGFCLIVAWRLDVAGLAQPWSLLVLALGGMAHLAPRLIRR
jgi:hypothetical protein